MNHKIVFMKIVLFHRTSSVDSVNSCWKMKLVRQNFCCSELLLCNQKITFFFTRALFRFPHPKIAPLNYFAVAILELLGAFFLCCIFFF